MHKGYGAARSGHWRRDGNEATRRLTVRELRNTPVFASAKMLLNLCKIFPVNMFNLFCAEGRIFCFKCDDEIFAWKIDALLVVVDF